MLAGKCDARRRPDEHIAPGRIEAGMDVRVSTQRPGIAFPCDRARGQNRRGRAKPAQALDDALRPGRGEDVLDGRRRSAATEQTENAARSWLLLVAIPD